MDTFVVDSNDTINNFDLSQDDLIIIDTLGVGQVYEIDLTRFSVQQNITPTQSKIYYDNSLIAERGLKQKDLIPVFNTESIVSDVLNGKQDLNKKHIQRLADFLNLSPAVFFLEVMKMWSKIATIM